MKKIGILIISLMMFITPVKAESYCVLGDDDNTVIEEKNMHEVQSVASISKIMTAVVAIEEGELTDSWEVSEAVMKAHGSSVYLKVGQSITLETLLYGLMLRSGNDAAVEIATHISGSEAEFVEEMNKKAKKLGMVNTHFHNASGLDDEGEGNMSTAYDMALLMSYAMKNPTFRAICGTKYYTAAEKLRWKNKNRLLFDFPFTTGGKTGFTKQAGRTLVTSASNGDMESVVVTMGIHDDFKFHETKHKASFDMMKAQTILKAGKYEAGNHTFTVKQDMKVLMHKDGTDTLQVSASFTKKHLIIRVKKNDQVSTFQINAKQKHQSFWKRVIPWI